MIENIFREQCKKNRILDNYSNKLDCFVVSNFDGVAEIGLDVLEDSYGMIMVNIQGVDGAFKLKLNNILLLSISSDIETILPINFKKNDVLEISGKCKRINLKLYSVKFKFLPNSLILPQNHLIINSIGNSDVYSYESIQDVSNNNLTYVERNDDGTIFVQTFVQDGVVGVGKIIKGENVYFCNSINNYADNIPIVDECDSIIFLQDYDNECLYFVYIENGKLYYRQYIESALQEEYEIPTKLHSIPISLTGAQTYVNNSKCFAVNYDNGSIGVYYAKYNANFQKIAEYKGKSAKLIQQETELYVVVQNNYNASVYNYILDEDKDNTNMLTLSHKMSYDNIIDCTLIEDQLILLSTGGVSTMVSVDEE